MSVSSSFRCLSNVFGDALVSSPPRLQRSGKLRECWVEQAGSMPGKILSNTGRQSKAACVDSFRV
jgi:hypothetical protein